ncbi:hypothetical protein SAMN05421504_103860 [Amycolatopsis xylanica]|uniref:Uncharacterized protein n=1 Tax=Amycolatopsis xylanica TaxID=589385 RepID=A0A1H3EK36_9PSEU|nr:hypothetical protein [Amycolatopsis xylanica]SDX79133.1 hypothetical protein SAMN05421504_103860 [Amycolatopsis xylanica]
MKNVLKRAAVALTLAGAATMVPLAQADAAGCGYVRYSYEGYSNVGGVIVYQYSSSIGNAYYGSYMGRSFNLRVCD